MDRAQLPLNALRAFEASARHLNFTRAAIELCVSQGAVSHQVAQLERRLGTRLFHRLPRGLALTNDGQGLVPALAEAFDRVGATLDRFAEGRFQHTLNIGVVGTFATGWLLERLEGFTATHPHIALSVSINNNRVDLAGEALHYAIRFGDGAWHGAHAEQLVHAPMTPLCTPSVARRLRTPQDLHHEALLRSYRPDEWRAWFDLAGVPSPALRGPIFDSSVSMVSAAMAGLGVALAPASMFMREIAAERLIQPFAVDVDTGRYWLTRLHSRKVEPAMQCFRDWLVRQAMDDRNE
jgi:LysR family transcriptional regulator of beta-lactamase